MCNDYIYPEYDDTIPQGDMPKDKIHIVEGHEKQAKLLFPLLFEEVRKSDKRVVISIYGGSGVGKTGIASLLTYYFKANGINAYTMSGDNYPHRIPKYNDMEREKVYEEKGRAGLEGYLGTELEINFKEVNEIIRLFHAGEKTIYLRRMGRSETELNYEPVDFSNVQVLFLEWTHGNNIVLKGIDIPVFLWSTPEETLARRLERNRDAGADSPFVSMVLEIEQNLLNSQADTAKYILSTSGEFLDLSTFKERLNG